MKNIILLLGVIVLIAGAYLDLCAITFYGPVLFLIGIAFVIVGIGLNHKDYIQLIRGRSALSTGNALILLINNMGKIIVLFFLAISIITLVVSVLYKSSDAFQTIRTELAKDGRDDLKFGLIVIGSMSKTFKSDVQGRACFEFSAYDKTGGLRMKYCLVEKNNVWAIIK